MCLAWLTLLSLVTFIVVAVQPNKTLPECDFILINATSLIFDVDCDFSSVVTYYSEAKVITMIVSSLLFFCFSLVGLLRAFRNRED